MTAFAEKQSEHHRISILKLLAQDQGFSLNESIMADGLDIYGHTLSRDQIRTQLTWLAEQNLITLDNVGGQLYVATITSRGLDVAQGKATVPGVKRPRPKA